MIRVGQVYTFCPVMIDIIDPRTSALEGDKVRVIHPAGCPAPGTMGHAHVETLDGTFLGLVHVNSLKAEA